MARIGWIGVVIAALLASVMAAAPSRPAAAQEPASLGVPGFDGPRPRAVYTPGTEAALAERAEREPYRSIFLEAHARHEARRLSRTPGDPDRNAQKDMTRAARWLAFTYAIDRTVIDGEVVPFPSPQARQTTGEIVEELLLGAYDRSRFAVPPPLGGWDRDIDTAGELLQWSGAFDTLLGAGFDFDGNDEAIAALLIELTAELYRNYTRPETANNVADLHNNNHRSKSGAAMATAAVVLAEYAPDPDADPDGSRQPGAWWDYGITLVDDMLRYVLVTGDGAYSEGPHYQRFTTESIAPYAGMWDRLLGDAAWTTGDGRVIPALHATPQFALTQDWMLAMTLPNGTLAPIDDANTNESHHFGALVTLPNSASYAWRWANAQTPYAQEGTVDLAVDSIVHFDDTIVAAEPPGSPTSFWPEGGNAVFRSDWGDDATLVIAQGEGPTASIFGRDAAGSGRAPQSHEHMEPGSFLLHAHGETLVLDPGYLSFGDHDRVLDAPDHNMVLVNGVGPEPMLANTFAWRSDLFGPPPQDGFASLHSTLDTDRIDAATVTSRYGAAAGDTDIELHRQFFFVDNRYLVIADEITPDTDDEVRLDWLVHGNGGGTSGGTYNVTADGGVWRRGVASVTSAIATDAGPVTLRSQLEEHESPVGRRVELTHEAQYATVETTGPTRALQVLVPSGGPLPAVETATDGTTLTIVVDDLDTGRTADVRWSSDGLTIIDTADDGTDPVALSTGASVEVGGIRLQAPGAAMTGLAAAEDGWELIAVDPAHSVLIDGITGGTFSGACAAEQAADRSRVVPGSASTFSWSDHADANALPAPVAIAPARTPVGASVELDATRSCDLDGDALSYSWEIVSAPRGSTWHLSGATSATPALAVDAHGTFRIRMTATDETGAASPPLDIEIAGGDRCADERDDDLDGLFDGADLDCDGTEPLTPADAVGVIIPGSYINALRSEVTEAVVERGIDGSVQRVAIDLANGPRRFAVEIGRTLGGATGRLTATDETAGVAIDDPWQGRLLEPAPGVIIGLAADGERHWIVVDHPDR